MVSFGYPADGPTDTLELRDPDRQVSEAYNYKTNVIPMMSGQIRTTVDTVQPYKTMLLNFQNIDQEKMMEADAYFRKHQGHYLLYTDSDSRELGCKLDPGDLAFTEVLLRCTKTLTVVDELNSDQLSSLDVTTYLFSFAIPLQTFGIDGGEVPPIIWSR